MDNLEQQLRDGLIQRTYEEVKEMYSKPEARQLLFEILGGVADAVAEGISGALMAEGNEDDIQDLKKEFGRERRKVCTEMRRKMYDPATIDQIARQSAQNAYANVGEQFRQFESQLSEMGFSEESEAKVKAAIKDITANKHIQEYVFNRLLEVAKTEGLEKALQKETTYAVTRELYPTREDYLAQVEGMKGKLLNLTGVIKEAALSADSEGDPFMRTLVEKVIVGAIEKSVETAEKLGKPLQDEQLNKIYGPQ